MPRAMISGSVIEHWTRLPEDAVGSSSLKKVFKRCVDVVLRDLAVLGFISDGMILKVFSDV